MNDAPRAVRDHLGRWRPGLSGNPTGRPRGSKNSLRRKRADRERVAEWSAVEWQTFHRRAYLEAHGDHGAAFAETVALWLCANRPPQQAGLCAQCHKTLDVPLSSVNAAPIRADGAWVHWGCLPWFLKSRWDSAKAELQRIGIT